IGPLKSNFASPFASGLCGSADVAAATLQNLADLGIDHVTVMPLPPNHEGELADRLLRVVEVTTLMTRPRLASGTTSKGSTDRWLDGVPVPVRLNAAAPMAAVSRDAADRR